MAVCSWEGKRPGMIGDVLGKSRSLEEACYLCIKEFQKSGSAAKVNVIACNGDKGVNLELFRKKFSLSQNDRMLTRTKKFEVFTDLNKNPEKHQKDLDKINHVLARTGSEKELTTALKQISVVKFSGKKAELINV